MTQQTHTAWPFSTNVFQNAHGATDVLPASYHYYEGLGRRKRRIVADPAGAIPDYLNRELSLGGLGRMLKHLWFAGSRHPATQLHIQLAMGRKVTLADRMDLHLLWGNDGRIFLKPIPRYLLDPDFCQSNLMCRDVCACQNGQVAVTGSNGKGSRPQSQPLSTPCMSSARRIALGFLYTYACLVCSEVDFLVANEERLLPRDAAGAIIAWTKWKQLVREILDKYQTDEIHPRFLRAELRLSRINIINRFTRLPPFGPYLPGWRSYGGLFRDNLTWMATATVFIALVLTAMQVGLATERLQGNASFQRASYGFTIFAILGPICAFGLVVMTALLNVAKDLPWLLQGKTAGRRNAPSVSAQSHNAAV